MNAIAKNVQQNIAQRITQNAENCFKKLKAIKRQTASYLDLIDNLQHQLADAEKAVIHCYREERLLRESLVRIK